MRTENDYTETDLGNISPNPRGEYDEKASYEYLDLISYQGGSYLCLAEPKTIVSGIAPKAGQNTEVWQMIALPGELTPEYIAMHDDTIAKAKQTEASRTAAELAQEAAETARTDVVQMHSETLQAATEARENCDSSAGYAQAAELSRKAAAESEQNINAQVTGFETEVSESVTQATEQIATARQKAVQTITSQQDTSVQAVKDQTAAYISEKNTEAKKEITDHAEQEIVRINAQDSVQQIQKNKEDVALLKEDLSNKITKFYASNQGEIHITDSDNGKIQDMMLYGKSEQFTTTGKNLLKIKDETQTTRGVTITAKDGVLAMKGTATETGWAILDIDSFVLDGMCILSANITGGVVYLVNKSYERVLTQNQSNALENAEASKMCFSVIEGKTYDVSNILVQVEKGSVATSYEPYTGGQPSPSPDYPQEIKSVVNPTAKVSSEDETESQTVALPYTLNAIPVSSDGNVTINGQQYIADYVDVERGKLVKMVDSSKLDNTQSIVDKTEWLLAEQQETDLTTEQITAFKALATYYPTTNISINSEQLDGYTVFNYPISMKNGWDYVKKQLNDNRDYIYDMDTQSAEAYVNSEYAVALTELEV